MDAREFCRQDVAPTPSDLAIALQGLDAETELALLGVFAFHQRVCDIPHRASERQLADTQLQWWRAQLTADAHSTHPSLQALARLRSQVPAITPLLGALLDTVETDIDFAGFAEQHELDSFLQQRGDVLLQLVCHALNLTLDSDRRKAIGGFLEYVQLVHDFPRHASAQVIYLPYSQLGQHGISAEQLCQRSDNDLRALFSAQTGHQRKRLTDGLRGLDPHRARQLAPILILLALRSRWLAATEADGYALQRYRLQLGALQRWQTRLKTRLQLATGTFAV
ncbi:squalene/phytoene synthase family protein [Permianibacter sp. IMCC34836]|uniref:squalene/phytoene synthase family protein n=1 Tax=Permianibacter fluminis TaxID=2738515 RepID=UPI001553CB51|nr:squalene/phytoene synthase family protein [Permianibacter fluminis]NQD37382.1 squalene/phytoene synthase family protein [Permianibacter fluminis]